MSTAPPPPPPSSSLHSRPRQGKVPASSKTVATPEDVRALFQARRVTARPTPASPERRRAPQWTGVSGVLQRVGQLRAAAPPPTTATTSVAKGGEARRSLPASAAFTPPTRAPTDPHRTLFLGRLAVETTAAQIRSALERHGRVSAVHIVCAWRESSADAASAATAAAPAAASERAPPPCSWLPRGYVFVEFASVAYRRRAMRALGRRMTLDGRRVVLDVERGRLEGGWLPARCRGAWRADDASRASEMQPLPRRRGGGGGGGRRRRIRRSATRTSKVARMRQAFVDERRADARRARRREALRRQQQRQRRLGLQWGAMRGGRRGNVAAGGIAKRGWRGAAGWFPSRGGARGRGGRHDRRAGYGRGGPGRGDAAAPRGHR